MKLWRLFKTGAFWAGDIEWYIESVESLYNVEAIWRFWVHIAEPSLTVHLTINKLRVRRLFPCMWNRGDCSVYHISMLIFSSSFLILVILCMRKLLDELINIKQWEKSPSYKLSKEKLKNVIGETIEIKGFFTQTMCFGGLSFYIVLFLFVFIPLSSAKRGRSSIKLYYRESHF